MDKYTVYLYILMVIFVVSMIVIVIGYDNKVARREVIIQDLESLIEEKLNTISNLSSVIKTQDSRIKDLTGGDTNRVCVMYNNATVNLSYNHDDVDILKFISWIRQGCVRLYKRTNIMNYLSETEKNS